MTAVIYETENARFEFSLIDATNRLDYYVSKHNVDEASDLFHFLSFCLDDPIRVPEERTYFGFIALDLLDEGKGTATCKICRKLYEPKQLKPVPLGEGKNPFNVTLSKKGGSNPMFKKKRRIPMFGGRGFKCPEGHALVAMITWQT